MLTESEKHISKIGIGSYGIGGRGHRDVELTELEDDRVYIDALVYTLQQGSNFTEISLGYGHGNALRLFKQALEESGIAREDLFITNSLYPRDLPTFDEVKKDVEEFYRIMRTDYADSTLITQSLVAKFGEVEVYAYLHQLLDSGRTRFVSLSNASADFIKAFKKEFRDKFIAHEGHLSFEVRALQDQGIFETCDDLGVTNIIWRPLRRNMTEGNNWPLLSELAEKYGKTQNQIILNWITHLGYYPMVMSANKEHIDENLASTNFQMSQEDYKRMTDFRPPNYKSPQVDWDKSGNGVSIVTLVTDFEKHIEK
ncbi:MAG: aldo/keto reductase [Patescibacteria group bacterium]